MTTFQIFRRWCGWRARPAISEQLARIEERLTTMANTLDDIKDNQAKEKALIEKLLGIIASAPAGSFPPEAQAEIDAIVADQKATLAEDTTAQS